MVTKKDLVIAVLATLCLTMTLFSIVPIRSVPEYDPWKDLDDNGVIDVKEYQLIKNAIPSMGDPTKNVNVTNWPSEMNVNVTNCHDCTPAAAGNDTIRIVLLDRQSQCVNAQGDGGAQPVAFSFAFVPKQMLKNVTRMQLE